MNLDKLDFSENAVHTFVAPGLATFSFALDVHGERRRFKCVNTRLELRGEEARAVCTELAKPNSKVGRYLHRVDRERANAIAREFIARQSNDIVRGGTTSAGAALAQQLAASGSHRTLGEQAPVDPAQLQEFADSLQTNTVFTERVPLDGMADAPVPDTPVVTQLEVPGTQQFKLA